MPRGPKLETDGSNRKEFIEGLFPEDPKKDTFRSKGIKEKITAAVSAGSYTAFLISDAELAAITGAWTKGWAGSNPACPASDSAVLGFMKKYFTAAKTKMWVPKLDDTGGSPPKYKLKGYNSYDLTGDGLAKFLKFFAAGAHFVVIHSEEDLDGKAGADFYYELARALSWSTPMGHSHYAGSKAGNPLSGLCYPWEIPDGDDYPYICALLVDHTAKLKTNSFFQLEGWPFYAGPYSGTLRDKTRHLDTDFATHNETVWNISTYGASVFSEKRGASIFLAPAGWEPKPTAETIMAPYRGAGTPQWWLKQDLIAFDVEQAG